MPAKRSVLVRHDGHITTVPVEDARATWVVRRDDGVERFYLRSGFAAALMSDDDQDGTLVYVERPRAIFEAERRWNPRAT